LLSQANLLTLKLSLKAVEEPSKFSRVAVASMLSGGTPTEALRFLDLAGIERYSDSTISEINEAIREPGMLQEREKWAPLP